MANAEVVDKLATNVREGAVVIQMENDTQRSIAIQQPRDEEKVREGALKELELYPQFAAKAYYVIPYKDGDKTVNVEGPSIKAAMALGRRWGNAANGARIISENDTRVQIEGVFLDYETNFRTVRPISVSKTAWSKKFGKVIPLRDDRLNMTIQAGASKAVRNAILNALPVGLVEEYTAAAKRIAAKGVQKKGEAVKPIAERVKAMFAAFAKIGIEDKHVKAYLAEHHELETDEAMLAHMIGIYNAIEDGQAKIEEVFPTMEKEAPKEPAAAKKDTPTIGFLEQKQIRALQQLHKVDDAELNTYLEGQYGFVGTENITTDIYNDVCKWIKGELA